MRKTKIVCTLGPATDDENILRQLMLNGMDVARLNFSHGTHEQHLERINSFKKIRDELGLPIALLLDTKGPEIRIKTFESGKIQLNSNDTFSLMTNDIVGSERAVSITYPNLPKELKEGDRILIDDGLIELEVIKLKSDEIVCNVKNGGILKDNKSVNIPNVSIKMPYMSKKDEEDIIFGIENDFDFIAASFTRTHLDVLDIRKILERNHGKSIQIIAKIENSEGVKNAENIIKVSDGIMVARGDMGVEIALEDLPVIQKRLIRSCYNAGKKVITATQMLDSMIRNPRPTRAETTDVANAIFDGTSAIMLSGETAVGKYPVESVKTMAAIAERAENAINYKKRFDESKIAFETNATNAISHATCTTAHDLGAAAIITLTCSGHTARMVSKFRPNCPIIAATTSQKVLRQLNLSWGVAPVMSEERTNSDELFDHSIDVALKTGIVKNGDVVVITGGVPLGRSGTTNILKVQLLGNALLKGVGVNGLSASAPLCVAKSTEEALREFNEGDILVVPTTTNELLPVLKHAAGIITEEEGLSTHAAIVGMTLEIPVITGAKNATDELKNGAVVTMDATQGTIYGGISKII